MKKYILKTKEEFATMLIQEYGYSEKLSNELAVIAAGYGAFPKEKKSWNGKKRCVQQIKRMPYHKENNPRCKLPCLLGSDYCRLHHGV